MLSDNPPKTKDHYSVVNQHHLLLDGNPQCCGNGKKNAFYCSLNSCAHGIIFVKSRKVGLNLEFQNGRQGTQVGAKNGAGIKMGVPSLNDRGRWHSEGS